MLVYVLKCHSGCPTMDMSSLETLPKLLLLTQLFSLSAAQLCAVLVLWQCSEHLLLLSSGRVMACGRGACPHAGCALGSQQCQATLDPLAETPECCGYDVTYICSPPALAASQVLCWCGKKFCVAMREIGSQFSEMLLHKVN